MSLIISKKLALPALVHLKLRGEALPVGSPCSNLLITKSLHQTCLPIFKLCKALPVLFLPPHPSTHKDVPLLIIDLSLKLYLETNIFLFLVSLFSPFFCKTKILITKNMNSTAQHLFYCC